MGRRGKKGRAKGAKSAPARSVRLEEPAKRDAEPEGWWRTWVPVLVSALALAASYGSYRVAERSLALSELAEERSTRVIWLSSINEDGMTLSPSRPEAVIKSIELRPPPSLEDYVNFGFFLHVSSTTDIIELDELASAVCSYIQDAEDAGRDAALSDKPSYHFELVDDELVVHTPDEVMVMTGTAVPVSLTARYYLQGEQFSETSLYLLRFDYYRSYLAEEGVCDYGIEFTRLEYGHWIPGTDYDEDSVGEGLDHYWVDDLSYLGLAREAAGLDDPSIFSVEAGTKEYALIHKAFKADPNR